MSQHFDFTITVPGRVNLIGEHTDYNGLPVLPMALERAITISVCRRKDRIISAQSEAYPQENLEFPLEFPIPKHPQGHWVNYLKAGMQGIGDSLPLSEQKKLCGCDLHITTSLPQNVGLASSSALVVASALALLHANQLPYGRFQLAEIMAEAEHYVGTRGGGMDQAACLLGKKGHALKIDFSPLRLQAVPLPDSVTVVVCDSRIRAKKTDNALRAYNLRAVECRFASLLLKRFMEKNHAPTHFNRLGDLFQSPWSYNYNVLQNLIRDSLNENYSLAEIISITQQEKIIVSILKDYSFKNETEYDSMVFACGKRYRHIITEGLRVEQSAHYLQQGDFKAFGKLMNEGHTSAREDFEISCTVLDHLVEHARQNGALGARLTGAGFGGCTVNLVEHRQVESFVDKMLDGFFRSSTAPLNGMNSKVVLVSNPGDGAAVI